MWRKPGRIRRLAIAFLAIPLALALILPATFFVINALKPFPAEAVAAVLRDARASAGGRVPRMDEDGRWRQPVVLEAVAPALVDATIAVEDKRFRTHSGIDPAALLRAVLHGVIGRNTGGSTLTMQTVSLLWPEENSLSAAFRALQMERSLGKDDILELYFNLAPYGSNITGAEAAAHRYFGKPAAALALDEAALLAGLPRAPDTFDPRLHPHAARQRRWQVLDRMLNDGYVSLQQAAKAGKQRVRLHGFASPEAMSRYSRLAVFDLAPSPSTPLDTAMPRDFNLGGIHGVASVQAVPAMGWRGSR